MIGRQHHHPGGECCGRSSEFATVRRWDMDHQWRVAARWYRAIRLGDRITRIDEPDVAPLLRCNIWYIRGRDRDLVVDGGLGVASLHGAFPELLCRETVAVATHTHVDHVGCLHEFERRGVQSPARAARHHVGEL